MEEYTCMIPRETQDGAFYRAALALHQNHFQQAQAVSQLCAHMCFSSSDKLACFQKQETFLCNWFDKQASASNGGHAYAHTCR